MLKNTIYSANSLETLLVQNSLNNSSKISDISYADILQSIKDTLEKKNSLDKADDEVAEFEKKFDKEMQQLRTEMAIFDLFHDVYVTNGLFSNASKAKLRKQKYSMWNSIFSMQAERVQAQTQIALQTAMRKQITLLK